MVLGEPPRRLRAVVRHVHADGTVKVYVETTKALHDLPAWRVRPLLERVDGGAGTKRQHSRRK